MKETLTNVIEMPEDTCGAVDELAMYLYHKHPPLSQETEVHHIFEAWVLADKLCMPQFQDFLTSRVMQFTARFWLHPRQFSGAFKRLQSDALILKFVRDQLLYEMAMGYENPHKGDKDWEMAWNDLLRKGFLNRKFLQNLVKAAKNPPPQPSKQGCKYHVHGIAKACTVGP